LCIGKEGIKDNFFVLEKYSLKATEVVYQIGKKFKVAVPLKTIFKVPTIADHALLNETMLIGF
jgi:hypothetical protein